MNDLFCVGYTNAKFRACGAFTTSLPSYELRLTPQPSSQFLLDESPELAKCRPGYK